VIKLIKDNYVRKVSKVESVIDGDTIVVWLDKGDYENKRYILRLLDIDTPERNQKGYYEAKEYVSQALENQVIHVQTVKVEKGENAGFSTGGFGRYLAIVYVGEGERQYCLNDRLLELELATLYKRR
jgi:endonuclease YncB( thermonuclease family)